MTANDIVQLLAVVIVIAISFAWGIQKLLRKLRSKYDQCPVKKESANDKCSDCPLTKQCKK